jgi:hypothetical protein
MTAALLLPRAPLAIMPTTVALLIDFVRAKSVREHFSILHAIALREPVQSRVSIGVQFWL